MEIYLSTLDRKNIFRFPYIDREKVDYSSPLNSEEFTNSQGKKITLIGEEGLFQMRISSFFPSKLYRWLPFNVMLAPECLKYFKIHRKSKLILTVITINQTFIKRVYIENFDYFEKTNKDVEFSLTLKEYVSK